MHLSRAETEITFHGRLELRSLLQQVFHHWHQLLLDLKEDLEQNSSNSYNDVKMLVQ